MQSTTKQTPLHGWHSAHGANMVDFGDYNMPLWYSGAKNEHLTVLTGAGMFDTSHMASVRLQGPDSFDLLQRCFTRDLNACLGKELKPIATGRCVYGAFLNPRGESIDDAIVYKVDDQEFIVVVNAGMGSAIARHLKSQQQIGGVQIADLTDRLGKFDLQGPLAVKIMRAVVKDPDQVFDRMVYFSFKGHFDPDASTADQVRLADGTPFLLSRSGYTGEVGFEVFIAPEHTVKAWEAIMAAGKDAGILPCGLAARDSLRAGALLPLSHQDIGHWPYLNHPWDFVLPYTPDGRSFSKDFIGAEALLAVERPEYTLAFVGRDVRKVDAHDAEVLDADGQPLGTVLTCATDMGIGRQDGRIYSLVSPDKPGGFMPRGLSCGFIKVTRPLEPGQSVVLKDNKRRLTVEIATDIRPDRTARRPLKHFI